MGSSDTRKGSILLVRKLYTLMQNLGPLPDDVYLNMKLSYYDDVTPHEYQPPGFKEGDSDGLVFETEPVHLTMGEVVTPFHVLKVDVTTERERLEQIDGKEVLCDVEKNTLQMEQKQKTFINKVMPIIQNYSAVKMDNSDNQIDIKTSVQVSCQEQKIYKETKDNSLCCQKAENEECSTARKHKTKENELKSPFTLPVSQEASIPKRRKFSEPKERY
uniref:HORMA domain containing 1 n=2 Tax=Scleropages formosus TaxID=113540 RepID=A0A8C9RKD2_SCLFO